MRRGGWLGAMIVAAGILLATAVPSAASAPGSISGTVTAEGSNDPVEKVRVCAFRESEEEFEQVAKLGNNCELTDANGKYTIAELPPGDYAVEFWPGYEGLNYVYQYYDGKSRLYEADLVQVTTTEKTGIDAKLAEGGEIQGKVVNASGGTPIKEVLVCAEESEAPWFLECAWTDSAGEYTIPGLVAGEYGVEFWPSATELNFLNQYYNGRSSWIESDPVTVTIGAVTPNIDAALHEGGQIIGTVTDAVSHSVLPGIEVCAFEAAEGEYGGCAVTGAGGNYAIKRLPSGSYKVVFAPFEEEEEGEYLTQFYSGATSWATASAISVNAGATRSGIDAALVKKGGIPPKIVTPPTALPVAGPRPMPKPRAVKCKKGYRKKKVRGKIRCVKVHKHKHHRSAARRRVERRATSLHW